MSNEEQLDEFSAYWLNPDQEELRSSCAKGWALKIWQASRAAIEVEWPNHYDYTNSDVAGAAVLDCRTAFQKAAGVKS